MNYSLFLDDCRKPSDVTWVELPLVEWTIVRSHKEFIKIITERGLPVRQSYDHDLDDAHYDTAMYKNPEAYNKLYETFKEKTGYDSAKWLVDYCLERNLPFPEYYIHTMNPVGQQNIKSVIESYIKFYEQSKR